VGSRLESHAAAVEVVLSADLYDTVAAARPGGRREEVEVRGRDAPVPVVVLRA